MEFVTLNNGVKMPMLGYGVYQVTKEECERCVADALSVGYRHIDTAAAYFNEREVGEGIRKSGVDRSEVFIETKVWINDYGYDQTRHAFEKSAGKLGVDVIDLLILHQPFPQKFERTLAAYRGLESLLAEGKVRAIGVSNFMTEHLERLLAETDVVPAVNQIEIHPFFQQQEALTVMQKYGVQPEAWGPLSEAQRDIFHHKVLGQIARRHGRTTAQVILRWHYQRGVVTIPKTVRPERMDENRSIWDFSLTPKEMAAIAGMDIGHSEIIDHRCYATARQLNSVKIHA